MPHGRKTDLPLFNSSSELKEESHEISNINSVSDHNFVSNVNSVTDYYFPEELIWPILCRLPPKSLVRFMLVSKEWHRMIKSNKFTFSHLQPSLFSNLPLFLISHTPNPRKPYPKNISLCSWSTIHGLTTISKWSLPYCSILGVINGVICLYVRYFILWNPLIDKCIQLPKPPRPLRICCEDFTILLGVGFDSNSNNFKVVRICSSTTLCLFSLFDAALYSLNEGAWKVIDASSRLNLVVHEDIAFGHFRRIASFLFGNLYWLLSNCALTFDLEKEEFAKIEVPLGLATCADTRICSTEGHLALIENVRHRYNIWIRKEANSWVKIYHINLEGQGQIAEAFGVRTSDKIFVVPSIGNDYEEILSLHTVDPKSKKIMMHGIKGKSREFYVSDFTPSLFLFDREGDDNAIRRFVLSPDADFEDETGSNTEQKSSDSE